LFLANSIWGKSYNKTYGTIQIGDHPIEYWINDGLMTIFFLLIGLELERELYVGELSNHKQALFP